MVAAQNIQKLLGTDNSTKSKKVETTIHHAKQGTSRVLGTEH
jgi:hypothetical protein